jgi:hypothetical protein
LLARTFNNNNLFTARYSLKQQRFWCIRLWPQIAV